MGTGGGYCSRLSLWGCSKVADVTTLTEALQLLKLRGVKPIDYKHLPPDKIIQLAKEGHIT